MRVNAAHDVTTSTWSSNGRVQIRIGAHRYTATAAEAISFADQLNEAAAAATEPDNRRNIVPLRKAHHAS